jgi:hypothetical protein
MEYTTCNPDLQPQVQNPAISGNTFRVFSLVTTGQTLTLQQFHKVDHAEDCINTVKTAKKKAEVLFYPLLPPFRKSTALWKAPPIRLLVLLIRATCRWKWVWRINEVILTQGKTGVLGEKPVPVPLCPLQISHALTWNRTRASAVEGRRLTPITMVLNTQFAPRSKHTPSRLYKPVG